MKWNKFTLKTVTGAEDIIIATLAELGVEGVEIEDKVNQKDPIAKAGSNIYNKELGNHLHIVVEKNGKIIDPELMYGKTNAEIK